MFKRITIALLLLVAIVTPNIYAQGYNGGSRLDTPVWLRGQDATLTVNLEDGTVADPIHVSNDRGTAATPIYTISSGTTTVTLPDPLSVATQKITSSTNYKIDSVATATASILSSVASITGPCSVEISCPAGELYFAPGLATTTVSSMKYHIIEEKQSRVYNIASGVSWDASVAGVSAVSSCSFTLHPLDN